MTGVAAGQPRSGQTTAVRVLLVDDQEPFRAAARMVLEMTDGFELVGEAVDGEQALDLFERLEPQLVLMDLVMPGLDGMETTRRLLRRHPGTLVIALSTYDEYAQQALDAGAVAFVPKSEFSPDEIIATWARVT